MTERELQKHVTVEDGSYRLAIENIVCHLNVCLTAAQKAAINWHPEQSVSLAVMRLIAMEDFKELAQAQATNAVDPSAQPRERGPRANKDSSSDSLSAAGIAARPALARPPEPFNEREYCRAQVREALARHGYAPNELQLKFRDGFWDRTLAELAICDALNEQGSIPAHPGDGVACVAQMIEAHVLKAAALARPAWQPIETAPERETVLVRWRDGGREKSSRAAYWPAGSLAMDDDVPEECVTEEGTNVTGGWFEDSDVRDPAYWPLGIEPTHWQALPPPPK